MKTLNWLIKKLELLREKLADRKSIKLLEKLGRKVNKINLGCNEADEYGI